MGKWRHGGAGTIGCVLYAALSLMAGAAHAASGGGWPCQAAAVAAEHRYALPPGLLLAIGKVESGQPVSGAPVSGANAIEPWPWSVNADDQSFFFPTKAAAIAWIGAAQSRGVASIDVGCFQINLHYHPVAFTDLNDALDPARNADYAARFLVALHARLGDWGQATGAYHSETARLAAPYRRRVAGAFDDAGAVASPPPESALTVLRGAWRATLPQDGDDRKLIVAVPPGTATQPSPAMLNYLPKQDIRIASAASVRESIWHGH